MSNTPVIFSWSGGKDSALALYMILQDKTYQVRYLLTTINKKFERVSMHGIQEVLLEQQVVSLGIPLLKVYVEEGTNVEYENKMNELLLSAKKEGINTVVFGDIFLEDLRHYREKNLAKVGMKACFPLWKKSTEKLIDEFIKYKFKTITCCVNTAYLSKEYVSKIITPDFIKSLPKGVDVCGENGEYHSFVFDGPIFSFPIDFAIGLPVYKPVEIKQTEGAKEFGFWFADLVLK